MFVYETVQLLCSLQISSGFVPRRGLWQVRNSFSLGPLNEIGGLLHWLLQIPFPRLTHQEEKLELKAVF